MTSQDRSLKRPPRTTDEDIARAVDAIAAALERSAHAVA